MIFAGSAAHAGFEQTDADPASPTTAPAVNPDAWDLTIRVYAGQNSNVPKAPDQTFLIGDQDSALVGAAVRGTYRFSDTEQWLVGITVRADGTIYTEDNDKPAAVLFEDYGSPHEYNQWTVHPTLFAIRRFDLDGTPATFGGQYSFRHEDAPDIEGIGLNAHSFQVNGSAHVSPRVSVDGAYSYTITDYDVTFPSPMLDDRDADYQRATARVTYHAPGGGSGRASLSVFYADNDAEGRNWDYDSYGVAGQIKSHLFGPFWTNLDLSYEDRDYGGFISPWVPAPGRKESEIWNYGVQFLWPITEHCMWDLTIRHTEVGANSPQFRVDGTRLIGGFTYTF